MTDSTASFDDSLTWYQDGRGGPSWIPRHAVALPIDDLGFRQAVTVVERMRTYRRVLWQSDRHHDRFCRSLAAIGLDAWSRERWDDLTGALLDRNRPWLDREELGVTILVTPGADQGRNDRGGHDLGRRGTEIAMVQAIDHARNTRWRDQGQSVVVTDVVQPPPESWSRQAKLRCRVHYYLADVQASQRSPGSTGLLIEADGTMTESSIANVAMVVRGQVHSPPRDRVLGGITQSVVEDIVREMGMDWKERPLSREDLIHADEVWLMGTDAGLWFADRVDNQLIGNGTQEPGRGGECYTQVRNRFDELTRLNG